MISTLRQARTGKNTQIKSTYSADMRESIRSFNSEFDGIVATSALQGHLPRERAALKPAGLAPTMTASKFSDNVLGDLESAIVLLPRLSLFNGASSNTSYANHAL